MWKKSFIQFFKIIRQNRFFTFLNLFGVSITIAIILIAAIRIETSVWPGGPEKNNRNMLFVKNALFRSENRMSMGGVNLNLIKNYFLDMKTPKAIAFSNETPWSYFGDNGVEEYNLRNVNAGWWEVFDYEFINGMPFSKHQVDDASYIAVIDKKVKERFFGTSEAVGKMLEIAGKTYKIVGVIKNVPQNCSKSYANIFLPFSINESDSKDLNQNGSYNLVFLGTDSRNLKEIDEEFEVIRSKLNDIMKEGTEIMFGGPFDAFSDYLIGWEARDEYAGKTMSLIILLAKVLLIMLLPALNLISIQLIRIHERSEEIGVRKAFGASRGILIRQILFENTLLTIMGALLGLLLTLLLVVVFKEALISALFVEVGSDITLNINYNLFFICLLASVLLSVISGIIPAIRMSKLQPVAVLKGGEI